MLNTWARVFNLDTNTSELEDEVAACVIALRQEVDFARVRLRGREVPDELMSPGFDRLKSVASPGQLHSSWNGHRANISSPECRHAFSWSAWVLRDEEEIDMPEEEMSDLCANIESLEQNLGSTEMSPYLRDFIQRQIDSIKSALRVYSIQGSRPLKEALHKVAGSLTLEREVVEAKHAESTDATKTVFAQTTAVIKKTAEICDSLDKIKKFGVGVVSLATTVGPLMLAYVTK